MTETMACRITGDAVVTDGPDGLRWTRTDPEIHIDGALLADDQARAHISTKYDVGEPCPHQENVWHARLHSEATFIRHVTLWLCNACLSGEGGECHSPGCALWLNRAPDLSILDRVEVCACPTHGDQP